jgi:anaerobic magnesium-protoporphyrin IX monomethyl ester cyclase
MNILLAHSNMLIHDPKQTAKMLPYPPLATLYAAGALRAQGHHVALFDGAFEPDLSRFERLIAEHRPQVFVMLEDIYHFISKMCLNHMRETACRMCVLAKAAGATVIASGPDVSDAPGVYLGNGADYVLIGEPDETLREVVQLLASGTEVGAAAIAGLAYLLPDGALHRTASRANLRNLDATPMPAWDLVDAEAYRSAWIGKHGYFSVNMVSSRGCTYACNWCAKPIWGRAYAQRSPESIADELAVVRQALAPDHLWFCDDIFGITPKWLREFDALVNARGIVTPYKIQTRVNLITDETAALLKSSGCAEVWLGAESGSQKILDAMDKGSTVEEIYSARESLKRAGIKTCFFIQFGYPGETFAEIKQTVKMIHDLLPDDIGISVSYPLPGTKFYERVKAEMGAKTHWEHSHDLAVMHAGEYDSIFYHELHAVLHRDLNLRLRLASGETGPELLQEFDDINAAWLELGRSETLTRHMHPARREKAATV